jgi:hypothetical protein
LTIRLVRSRQAAAVGLPGHGDDPEHRQAHPEISNGVWVHIGVADREEIKLLDLMRVDLGFSPLTRERPTLPRPGSAEPPTTAQVAGVKRAL